MIPTSVTGSSPPTATLGINMGGMQVNSSALVPGSNNISNGSGGSNNNSVLLGIASLILEGRAMSEDEYAMQTTRGVICSSTLSANSGECGRQSPKPSTSRAAFAENYGSGGSKSAFSIDLANYQARNSSNSPELSSSLLRDYYSSSSESASSSVESNHSRWSQKLSQLRQESPNAQHQSLATTHRIAVECPRGSEAEFVALAINTDHHGEERKSGGDFEILRRMSINQINLYNSPNSMSGGGSGTSSSISGGSGSSENFMCSLQSLASNSCLRAGGSPLLTTIISSPRYSNSRQISNSSRVSTPTQYQHHQQQQQHQNNQSAAHYSGTFDNGIQSSLTANAWNSSSSNPHVGTDSSNNKEYLLRKTNATQRISIPSNIRMSAKCPTTPTSSMHQNFNSNIFNKRETLQNSLNSSNTTNSSNICVNSIATATATTANTSRNQTYPQQGPHCDQFLRKMGLAKGEASETEEHHCDMSYVNITCTRWRAYCIKMENILARGEPLCIEVYLGPVGHKILLEQWIITQKEKQPPPTMTLPSLCSAIRSQLYFSQISAWCDLIKKSDKTIYETGRIIFTTPSTTTSAAGDLATTTATATANIPTSTSTITTATSTTSTHNPAVNVSNMSLSGNVGGSVSGGGIVLVGCGKRRPPSPRLNIFYRIKQYDSTACFNSKPNVHYFPNVNITDNCCISVCLKSLPRITGGIPKVGLLTAQQQNQQQQQQNNTLQVSASAAIVNSSITPTPTTTTKTSAGKNNTALTSASVSAITINKTNANKPTISIMNCDNNDNLKEQQLQQQHNKTLTANTRCSSSSSSLINGNKTNQPLSSFKNVKRKDDNLDLEYGQDFDLSAGGDGCSFTEINVGDCDSSNSSFSTNTGGNLSHREKQLLKYRKRMMKRDKKQQQLKNNEIFTLQTKANTDTNNLQHQMEQGEDDDDDDHYQQEININVNANEECVKPNLANDQRQQLPNNHEIIVSIPSTNQHQHQLQQQEQEHEQQHHVKMISTGTQTVSNTCTSCGLEKSMICLKCNPLKSSTISYDANAMVTNNTSSFAYEEMDAESSSSSSSSSSSAASSLSSSDIIHTPRNKAELLLQAIQRTPKTNKKHKHKSKDSNQITAINQKQQQQQQQQQEQQVSATSNNNHIRNSSNNDIGHMLNTETPIRSSSSTTMVGCQLCKRQKTQHNFNSSSIIEDLYSDDNNSSSNAKSPLNSSRTSNKSVNISKSGNAIKTTTDNNDDDDAADNGEEDNETDGGKMLSSDNVDNFSHETKLIVDSVIAYGKQETMEEEYFVSSTKLTPHIDRCSLDTQLQRRSICNEEEDRRQQSRSCSTPPLEQEKIKSSSNEDALVLPQFKTPTPSEQKQNIGKERKCLQPQQPHKQTPKPNLLHIACNFNKNNDEQQKSSNATSHTPTTHNPLLLRRSLPKVNLTPIFCNPSSVMAVGNTSTSIPIGSGACNETASSASTKSADISITEASPTFSFESPSSPSPSVTVQKSNSAPTLPNTNSNSLSPRFVKASAIYKRRSRHLSDRSDRSSLGSDEQFSDEDVDSGMYSPFATSPVKLRTRLAVFGRKALLGNLEECLLQRRLVPKIEVMGFKLLLGASGGFCPTQLTIPAAAYFYELKGETLSTPYLCEIRLPRKGYTVPRCGTVQATLLNPMGMVVRMFVIPYDMRDMPSLHQTFIRQRILADTGLQSSELGDISQNGNCIVDNNGLNNATINANQLPKQEQQRSPQCNIENNLGHFISAENMKSLRYSIHLRFQTSRSGRLMLHTDIRLLISRRTDCDTAAAHAKGVLEAPNELITNTVMPTNPKYSARQDQTSSKI